MHYEKYKHISAGPLLRHYDRTGTARNSDVDESRSHLNYNLCEGDGSALERLRACVGVPGKSKGWAKLQNRADVNTLCDWAVTMPRDLPKEYEKAFFKHAYNYLASRFGVNDGANILSAYVHKDEETPHMHFAFVPLAVDKKRSGYKVCAKEAVTLADLCTIHREMQEYLSAKLGVTVNLLNGNTKDGNKSVKQLKAETSEKVAAAQEAAAAAEEIVASVDRRAVLCPATTPTRLGRLFGVQPEPAKIELSPDAYKKLRETAKTGAENSIKLSQVHDNAELVQMLNEEVFELRQQLREKDQRIKQLLKVEEQYKRIEKKLGREQLAKILFTSQLQRQARISPTPALKPKAHAKTRDSSDYSR